MQTIYYWMWGSVITVGIILGMFWLLWHLWIWVLPQIWINGPENLIHPGYWLFVGIWVLLSTIVNAIFKKK